MSNFLKANWPIVAAFSLPIIFVLGIAISVYVPAANVNTPYKALYAQCTNNASYYECTQLAPNYFSIKNGKLTITELNPELYEPYQNDSIIRFNNSLPVQFYIYDGATNTSTAIPQVEAQNLSLLNTKIAPDGSSIQCAYNSNYSGVFFMFNVRDSGYDCYLLQNGIQKKLEIPFALPGYYSRDSILFISWFN